MGQDAAILKRSGEEFLSAKKHALALDAFLKYDKASPGDAAVLCNLGICHFHLNGLEQAENYLNQSLHSRNNPPPEVFLYIGKLHHAKLEFGQAAGFYKKFLQKTGGSHPLRAAVIDDIRRCATGIRTSRLPAGGTAVVNLGETVNSPGDDFKPILSPNHADRLYFSTARHGSTGCDGGECKSDLFFTDLADGDWEAPRPLSIFLNSSQHEVALDFSDDGSMLYFFRGETLYSGDILVDTFRKKAVERTLFSAPFDGPMRPWEGDRSLQFFNDTVLLFASRRPGGYGGLDLYIATFTRGVWSVPENLGPVINSPYDETSPFLATDGRTLYFSTNDARRSMGGLDVLRSTYLDHAERWTPPENLGAPINSAGDDEHFTLTANGAEAFFSSSRKQGYGERDLYVALFDRPRPEQAATSLPVAFHLVPAYRSELAGASEAGSLPTANFFDEIATFEWPVLPIPAPGGQLEEEALRGLQQLAVLMKKFPAMKVTLAVHTDMGDYVPGVCENAFHRAATYLRQEGADLDNLALRCAGAEWPVDQRLPAKNRRLEIFVVNPEVLPFKGYHRELPPGTGARFFQKVMSGLCYQVVVEMKGGEAEKLMKQYPKGMTGEHPSEGRHFFTPGLYLTYHAAEEWRKKLEQDGYPAARVAPLLYGWEISQGEAAQYLEQFPDLEFFIGMPGTTTKH